MVEMHLSLITYSQFLCSFLTTNTSDLTPASSSTEVKGTGCVRGQAVSGPYRGKLRPLTSRK